MLAVGVCFCRDFHLRGGVVAMLRRPGVVAEEDSDPVGGGLGAAVDT
jgi:hypothetical protein